MPGIGEFRQDFFYGLRLLAKSPGFATVSVLSLALGIGANTAIFSLIDAVLLKMLPVKDPRQLVCLTDPSMAGVSIGTSSGKRGLLSNREFEALRDRTHTFSGVFAAQSAIDRNNASIDGKPTEELRTSLVSGNYFTVLGAGTAIGRTFTSGDEHGPGSAPYAVLSYQCWQRRFGGSPAVLDSHIHIGKADLAVIGVAQTHFLGENVGVAPDLWIPLDMQPQIMPGRMWLEDDPTYIAAKVMWLQVIGRLKPGVSRRQAQASVDVVFKQVLAEEFSKLGNSRPDVLKTTLVLQDAANGISSLRGSFADPLYVLMAFVALVLVIACANVANLLLARTTSRQKEMGVRLALGAGRARIIRQFLTESLTLSVAGGGVGALFAIYGVRLLMAVVGRESGSMILDVSPDPRVLTFTIGVSLLTGLIFGLAPAWHSAAVNASSTLKEAGRGMTGSAARIGAGKILVIGQIALSVMLLIGAGWFVRTVRNLQNVDLGYRRDKLLLVRVDFLAAGYQGARLPIVYNEVRDRLQHIPGVRAVAYSQNGLFSGTESEDRISVEGYRSTQERDLSARFDQAGPGYFKTAGIPILLGRDLGPQDVESAEPVCVVNEAFAKFYFGMANPIGKHVTDEFPDTRKTFVIVGVSGDARDHRLRGAVDRRFYLSAQQKLGEYSPSLNFEIRTFSETGSVIQAARRAILALDPALPIQSSKTLVALVDDNMQQERVIAQLSAAFGALALLLAAIGLYGVLSYAVAQRTNEIGVRMALGAQRSTVISMVLRETAMLIVLGLTVGVPASLACARLVQSKLFGLKPSDPFTLGIAVGIMIAVAFVSSYMPARRASRVDPLIALRYE